MLEGQSASEGKSGLSSIDLVSVRQGLVVAECLSFHRAARVLGTQQSTVGRRVRALEDVLGVSLFERTPAGVRLTIAGARFSNKPVLFCESSTTRFRPQALPVGAS
jgi:Bacterial regulatory helix-turn-helix protein, lysR family